MISVDLIAAAHALHGNRVRLGLGLCESCWRDYRCRRIEWVKRIAAKRLHNNRLG